MQKDSKFFEDIAKMASGAAGNVFAVKKEIETLVSHQVESLMLRMGLASQDECTAIREMLAKLLEKQDNIEIRLQEIEHALESLSASGNKTADGEKNNRS